MDPYAVALAVGPVAESWARNAPGERLFFEIQGGRLVAQIGDGQSDLITLAEMARMLGVSQQTVRNHNYYGLKRGLDKRFSRLQVERLRDRLAGN